MFGTVDRLMLSFGPVQRGNLPASIADRLRAEIEQGRLRPGEQLPGHRELAAMFSVSVGTVREAISMLTTAGLIETRAGRGTFVAERGEMTQDAPPARRSAPAEPPLERTAIEELIEAGSVIAVELAARAAERASPEQIAALEHCVERMEAAAASPVEYLEADADFHRVLAEAAANRYLLRAMADLRSLMRQDLELGAEAAIRRFGDVRVSVDSHRRLVEAISARDPKAARETLAGMVGRTREFVLGLYALGPSPHAAGAQG